MKRDAESPSTGVFENVLGFNPDLSTQLVSKTRVMSWLLERIQSKTHDDNRSYAAELLSILLQNSVANRQVFGKSDGVEAILKVLSVSDCQVEDPCKSHSVVSNFGIVIPWMRTKQNSWKICLMPCVRRWQSLISSRSSWLAKASTSWC